MLAFRSLDPFRALREPDRRRRDEERLSRSEQRTLSKTQNNHLTGKAPYKFESALLQRGVRCELDPTGSATCLLRATRPFHAGVDVDHRKPRIVAETNGTNGVQADHPLVQRRSAECARRGPPRRCRYGPRA